MDSSLCSTKYLTLKDIQLVIDSLGNFMKSTLNTNSLALLINNSGEATFTSCRWKLLSEAGFSYPLTKIICNAAVNYTKSCGDDCKYFLLILNEMFNFMHSKVNEGNEVFMRRTLIDDLCAVKQSLPCIFKMIQNALCSYVTKLPLDSFIKDLYSIVFTFMSVRFSRSVSKVLSSLICDFVDKIDNDSNSLVASLEYVISHFDIFCCKILSSSLTESKIVRGNLLYKKCIPPDLNVENCKFIVIWDLAMKQLETECASWKIMDESFVSQLDSFFIYQKIFEYFKSRNIMLLLTPSASDRNLKLLCEKTGVKILDRLQREEIECLLACFNLCALENLNECIESHHIGEMSFAKSFSTNKSYFVHLNCINSVRLFNVHHILLSAPSNAVWKEYYSECLNCFKMICQWLKTDTTSCFQEGFVNQEIYNWSEQKLTLHEETKDFCICCELKVDSENDRKFISCSSKKRLQSGGVLLVPGLWELLLKCTFEQIPKKFSLSSNIALQAMNVAIVKCICEKIGVSFADVKDLDGACFEFMKRCETDDVRFLEPVVSKEIMIYNVLDLLLQLLKIESIVYAK